MAAGGTLPDLFQMNSSLLEMLTDQGMLLDITELFDNSPNLKLSVDPAYIEYLTEAGGGRLYGFTQGAYDPYNVPVNTGATRTMLYRKDWADALNLDTDVETIDDFYNMLKAFTEQDPDGNGLDDTYGMTASKSIASGAFNVLWGAYEISPLGFYERDGVLKQGLTLPESKEIVGLINKWYTEGIIDPEFLITETAAVTDKLNAGKVGMVENHYMLIDPADTYHKNFIANNPDGELSALGYLMSSEDVGGKLPLGFSAYGGLRGVSADVEDPERLFKMIDWTTDISETGGFYFLSYGVEGEDYTLNKETNQITVIPTADGEMSLQARGLGSAMQWQKLVDRRWVTPETAELGAQVSQNYYYPDDYISPEEFTGEYTELSPLWEQNFAKFITGERPMSEYDAFVAEYLAAGGQEYQDGVNRVAAERNG